MLIPAELSSAEIADALVTLNGWSGGPSGLKRKLVFEEFRGAMDFMSACVEGIEQRNHHPVWTNKYNSIDIHLDTFDIGHKVSAKDLDLARFINRVLSERGAEFGLVED